MKQLNAKYQYLRVPWIIAAQLPLLLALVALVGVARTSLGATCSGLATNFDGVIAPVGVNDAVSALAQWDPDGPNGAIPNMMVIGGRFTSANGIACAGLVGWDGTRFRELPSGAGAVTYPRLLTTWDQDGPGGPQFPRLVAVSYGPNPIVGFCDGLTWSGAVQFGNQAKITAVTTWAPFGAGSRWLIIAGENLQVGGVGPSRLLRFDGTTWASLADFTGGIQGVTMNALTAWDPDGAGPTREALVFGGRFASVNGVSVGNLAWLISSNGTSFVVGTLQGGVNGPVDVMQNWNGGIAIGGRFSSAGGATVFENLVFWNAAYFKFSNSGSPAFPSAMAVWDPDGAGPLNSRLVLNSAPGAELPGVYAYNQVTQGFEMVATPFSAGPGAGPAVLGVWDIAGSGAQPQFLFAGGSFTDAGDLDNTGSVRPTGRLNHIARINTGKSWLSLPNVGPSVNHLSGSVNAMMFANIGTSLSAEPTRLYVAGAIDFAGPAPVSNFAGWNGTTWQSVGAGFNDTVFCLGKVVIGRIPNRVERLYAGGAFTASGNTPLGRIARLTGDIINGYTWQALGSGLNGPPSCMIQFIVGTNDLLVVGGNFTTAGGNAANRIAAWNHATSTWSTFGSGFDGPVSALAVFDPDDAGPAPARLIAGGNFTTASGIPAANLAQWDGIQWLPFEGGGTLGPVNELAVWPDPVFPDKPRLVVAGSFSKAGNTTANGIAVWSGGAWETVFGSGLATNANVNAMTTLDLDGAQIADPNGTGEELIIAGLLVANSAGEPLPNLAKWDTALQRWVPLGRAFSGYPGSFSSFFPNRSGIGSLLPRPPTSGDRPKLIVGGHFWFALPEPPLTYNQNLVVWSEPQPYISAAPPAQVTNCPGTTISLTVKAVGDGLVYRWQRFGTNLFPGPTSGGSIIGDVTASTLFITNCSALDAGAYACQVFNSCGTVTSTSAQVIVDPSGCPPPPQIVTTSPLPAGTMLFMPYGVALVGQNGFPPYTWSLTSGALPPGLSLTAGAMLQGLPMEAGTFNFELTLTDSAGSSDRRAFTLTIFPEPVTILSSSPLPAGTAGVPYSHSFAAAKGTAPYTWTLVSGGLPGGLNLNSSGALNGSPASAGTSNFTVRVTDAVGSHADKSFALTIAPAQPVIPSPSVLPGGTLNNPFYYPFSALGGVPPYTWSTAGPLPPGLNLSPQGKVTGTPTSTGPFNFQVQVSDSRGFSATAPFNLTITSSSTSISPPVLSPGEVGVPYFVSLAFNFGSSGWTLSAGTLPDGLTLSSTGVISGTPTNSGLFEFMVRVEGFLGSASRAYQLEISPPRLTVSTASPLPPATAGSPYSHSLIASNGAPPYFWSLSAGVLPPGIELQSNGVLVGTPTAPGNFDFTVRVQDSLASNAVKAVSLSVLPAPLTIVAPAILPPADVSSSYSFQFTFSGGTPPYFWSWLGAPPPGLFLDNTGLLSGTPYAPGNYTFSVHLYDLMGASVQRTFSINVRTFLQFSVTAGAAHLTFPAVPGQAYTIEANDDLADALGWTVVTNIPPQPFPGTMVISDPASADIRFYRIRPE